jgi:hypothetical protein
VYKCWDLALQ